ncbi:MAG: DtxR family transcriptional regulator [Halanaerobiales bacterium]
MADTISLSSALEDYLEAILLISEKQGSARITDIAEKLDIAASSAKEVVDKLINQELVQQEKYGPVILTEKGREYAQRVSCRHKIIREFLTEVLGINEEVAEKDSCMIEHVVSDITMEKLVNFLLETGSFNLPDTCLKEYLNKNERGERMQIRSQNIVSLDNLSPGEGGRIVRLSADGNLKRRLLDMGLMTGAELTVKGRAPLGDPIEITVRGYNLSLRKKEAANVYVEVE